MIMNNLITKYQDFLFEASTDTQISSTKLEISKIQDQLQEAKNKMVNTQKSAGNEAAKMAAESIYVGEQVQIYGKMIPLLNALKTQIDQRVSELKG